MVDTTELPELRDIREPKHPGVTRSVCAAFAEAAEVCLARHHRPPETVVHVDCCGQQARKLLKWRAPTPSSMRAWNNRDDATRDAAYIVSLAAIESELGLVALARAETRTGADYYVGNPSDLDLESARRLEVSGTDTGSKGAIRGRLREKVRQVRAGASDLPAFASVVGFREALVLLDEMTE